MVIKKIAVPVIIILILVGTYFWLSKKPDSYEENQLDLSQLQIQQQQESKVDQLKIEDIKVGTGPEVKPGDTVVMHYNGTLENGEKFDSSYGGKPFETKIGVGQVIEGWDQGVPGMKVGGKRKLIIPSDLAYGDQGIPGAIPPKATLIFEVELLEIK
jgi:peptidylprolyl isomerase